MSNVYNYLNYERLTDIVKKNKPYRRTTDRYPLSYRQHGYKCFFVKQDEAGNNEYHIAYQWRWTEEDSTKEEYEDGVAKNLYGYRDRGNGVYTKWVRDWGIIGIVRKDNTFEFTTDRLHQGTRYFLSSMFNVNKSDVTSSIKHGGAIYKEYTGDWRDGFTNTKVIPLFQGQRIDLATNNSTLNYEVQLPYVNRQRSKEAMAQYKDSLNVAELFFKTMTKEIFSSEMQEVFNEVYPDEKPNWRDKDAADKLVAFIKSQIGTDLYKAMYATMMYKGTLNAWSIGAGNPYAISSRYDPFHYFKSAKTSFIKQLKLENKVHDIKTYGANEAYPSNSWEVKVFVDGKQVKVY